MSLTDFVDLTLAALLGAAIGFERQWYQGMAGLRTNALVAFGAACFVGMRLDQAAALIVSGIGFLGAGIIFREGASVRGLNTAATLWCSAACGALSGAGHYPQAVYGAAGVIAINLVMRYAQAAINRWRPHPIDLETDYLVEIDCAAEQEAMVRALLSDGSPQDGLGLKSLHSRRSERHGGTARIVAEFIAHSRADEVVEQLVSRAGLENGVISARWSLSTPTVAAAAHAEH
jgi:putative Mg2+ transporter-C (MgtC) family protein